MNFISYEEEKSMAKGQKNSSREVKKPKQSSKSSNKPVAAPIFSVPPRKK
jgi:hypothetical protein